MSERMQIVYIIGVAVAVGVTAGTAAAISASAFPYALAFSLNAVNNRLRKKQTELKLKLKVAKEKSKKSVGSPSKEQQSYREAILKGVVEWKDSDVTFDTIPYHVSEATKTALLDSIFLHLKRPEFGKTIGEMASMSPRILLTGPPGSELFQEKLVLAVAHHLEVKCLVFDSMAAMLHASQAAGGEASEHLPLADAPDPDSSTPTSPPSLLAPSLLLQDSDFPTLSTTPTLPPTALPPASSRKTPSRPSRPPSLRPQPRLDASTSETLEPPRLPVLPDAGKRVFKKGDRVRYVGTPHPPLTLSNLSLLTGSTGLPPVGLKGRVVLVVEEVGWKVGVRFERAFGGGSSLLDLCEEGQGAFCNVGELRMEGGGGGEDAEKMVVEGLMEVLASPALCDPSILFIREAEKAVSGQLDRYVKLEKLSERSEGRLVIVASHTMESRKEKTSTPAGISKSSLAAFLDLGLVDQMSGRGEEARSEQMGRSYRILSKLFPNKLSVGLPQDEGGLKVWDRQMEADLEKGKAEQNRRRLQMAMLAAKVECKSLSEISIPSHSLTHEAAERIVGCGSSHHLQTHPELGSKTGNGKLLISADSLRHGISIVDMARADRDRSSTRKALKDVVCDNEFEKALLSEVIPPTELGVSFADIGALDAVKETLKEVVMMPLQRPELFVKGQLAKPVRGLLLFGPPGTGKTMLAKAVATDAGANFINISTATISSKWFGEAEKYVKAVFSLASKIAPAVIFIDEVDSMLGRRGKEGEHSAMRKVKNELMTSWDGLRTREKERVLLLAATNRPFDLDDAVIRRFPRRIMIDLPDAANRAKILKLILSDEDLSEDFSLDEVASAAEGYSGSDLKNLCTTAAYSRIREILDKEQKERELAKADGRPIPAVNRTPFIRPLTNEDMKKAMEKVRSSVSTDTTSMVELTQWNEQFGEGGSRRTETLSYFM